MMSEEKQDVREVVVNATIDQINEFKGSILWMDIQRELDVWLEGFQREYGAVVDNCMDGGENSASALTHIGNIRGREQAIDYLLQLPDMFLELKEDKKDESRRIGTEGQQTS